MNDNPFQSLINLIEFDQSIKENERTIATLDQSIADIKTEQEAFVAKQAQATVRLRDAEKLVRSHENTMNELDAQESAKKANLDTAADGTQYKAIKKEIDFIKKQQHDLEPEMMSALNNIETAKKSFNEKEEALKQEELALTERLDIAQVDLERAHTKRAELEEARRPREEGIPAEWLTKYSIMKNQDGSPIAEVTDNFCSGCFYSLTPQDLLNISNKKLIQCGSCYRFLYKKAESDEEEQQSE